MCQITKPSVQDWIDYEGTNITEEKAVKDTNMQLNDALIESCTHLDLFKGLIGEPNMLAFVTRLLCEATSG